MKYILAITIIIMFIMLSVPSSAIDDGYARVVYNVRGLQDYDLHWNDRFPPGSRLMIYAEANGVNHRRAVAVDYIFIIRDPNNNIVNTASFSNVYEDYRENDFTTYLREIPPGWEDGVYTAEIHILDLLNESLMQEYYADVISSYLNETDIPDLPIMNRSNATPLPEQHIIINKTFYIDKYSNKYPVDRFKVENIMLDRTKVAPNIPVIVSVNVTNTFYDPGSTSLLLFLDNRSIDNATIEVEGYATRQVFFTVSTEFEGIHRLEIVPMGADTIGLDLIAVLNVSVEKEIEIPTSFSFKDIQIDSLSVEPGEIVTITVTLENEGRNGSQPVELYINNALEEERVVYLNFSEIKDIKFNVTRENLGAYRVMMGSSNLSKIFFVETDTTAPPVTEPVTEEKPSGLRSVLLLSVLVIFLVILRLYMKRKFR